MQGLNIKANGNYVDGTFGRGGHSGALLSRLNQEGHLLAVLVAATAHQVVQEQGQALTPGERPVELLRHQLGGLFTIHHGRTLRQLSG